MSMHTFRVRFTERQCLAINISAVTAEDAIGLAQDIRRNRGIEPFEVIDDGVGDAADWEAELLTDDCDPRLDQVLTALKRLRCAAGNLDAALDGITEQFEQEQRRLAEALAGADLAILNAKGGVR